MPLTERQQFLCRFAIGLPNSFKRSYRNRFFASRGSKDYRDWRLIVDAGYALRYPWATTYGDLFVIKDTQTARRLLLRGEKLDTWEFPCP
jgi:hypothetical protein